MPERELHNPSGGKMKKIKTAFVEDVHDSLKPDDPFLREATRTYLLYFTEKEELLKVKGFDEHGRVTYNKGFTILSTMTIESDTEVFIYKKNHLPDEKVVHRLVLSDDEKELTMETFHSGKLVEKWTRRFNEDGYVVSDIHSFVPYDAELEMIYELDDRGHIIKSTLYDLDREEERVTEFKYEGDLLKETLVSLRGISGLYPSIKKEYLHSKDGRLMEEKEFFYPDLLLKSIVYYYEGENLTRKEEISHIGVPGGSVVMFHYNKEGDIIKEEGFENDILSYVKELEYDDNRRLILQIIKDADGNKLAEIKYQYSDEECMMPDRLKDFFKDRFYLDLSKGALASETGFSKTNQDVFTYTLLYEYRDGFLSIIRKKEGEND